MADDKKSPGAMDNSFRGGDPRTIDIESPGERAFWCKILLVSEDELLAAIAEAGTRAQSVKDHLARKRQSAG